MPPPTATRCAPSAPGKDRVSNDREEIIDVEASWDDIDQDVTEAIEAREEGRDLPAGKCKAHNRSGDRCGRPVEPGKEVCRLHGGLSTGAPPTAGMKFSKFLPARIRQRYEEFVDSPGWLELKHEIGLLSARIADLMEGLNSGEAPLTRREWRDMAFEIRELYKAGEDCNVELNRLCESLDRSKADDDIWDKTMATIEQQRKLKETEVKRMVAANQVLTVQESYTIITRLVSLTEEYVKDEKTRTRMIRELHTLLDRKNDPKALNNGRMA